MKKIFRLMAALAATTVAFSCVEEANPEGETTKKGTHYDGPMTTLTFNLDELETKTTWDGETHAWEDGDQIKIVYSTEDDAFALATIKDGQVTATVGDVETYYAVYPETTKHTLTEVETDGSTTLQFAVTIPDGQDGSFREANIMAAKTSKADMNFSFKNLTHIFKFYRSEDSEFKGFRFLTNSSQDILLRGTYPVTLNDDGTVEMGEPTGQSRYISCVGLEGTGPFYVGFAPGVNMDYGFAVAGTRSDKNNGWAETALTTGKIVTDRSVITNLKIELDKVLHNDWYIKETATGKKDGTSWDDAGDITTLLKLIGNEITEGIPYNGNTNCMRLDNAKIYIAAGEYDIPTTLGKDYLSLGEKWGYDKKAPTHKTEIFGGFPANATGKDISTRDVDAYPTKFVNPYKAQNNRAFNVNETTIPDLTFDGITFTKSSTAGNVDTGRGRIMLCTKATGNITFNNCRFSDLNTSNNLGGAAINIRKASSSEFIMNFNECKFTNNSCTNAYTYGGVIMLEPDTENATVNINGCTFTSNTTAVTNTTDNKSRGGAIFAAAGVMNISGTTFEGNTSQHYGGAIYADRTAEINISGNCTFKSNTASYGGAIHTSGIKYNVNKCSFDSNSARRGGAISNEIGILIVNESSFTNNGHTNNANGGAILSYDEYPSNESNDVKNKTVKDGEIAIAYVYNCNFEGNYTTTTDGTSGQGAAIQIHGLGKLAAVNSSFGNHNNNSHKGGVIRARGSKASSSLYIINCTMNNKGKDLFLQYGTSYVYNSLILGEQLNTGGSATHYNSILGNLLYTADGSKSETSVTFADQIGQFNNGVFPVKAGSVAATDGMSSSELAALGEAGSALMTAMPLFETKYLTVDQKGNERTGSIMGAYVGQ